VDTSWKSSPIVKRHPANPVLSAKDVPYRADLVFNAGVVKYQGRYAMVFRNDYCGSDPRKIAGTCLGLAFSRDGIRCTVEPKPCFRIETVEIIRVYDPRLTVIEGRVYMCFAADTRHGIRGGVAVTDDFEKFDVLSMSVPDNRNMVLFPAKIGGKFARLERPFPVYGRYGAGDEAFDIWFSDSPDCAYWGNSQLVLGAEKVPYANCKIGPGAPPIRTRKGWLAAIHAVHKDKTTELPSWHKGWHKRYAAGLMLLDMESPWKVIGFCRQPLLAPEEPYEYEMKGYRGSVIFPTGMVLEDDGEVKIYYGAADTVVALATASLDDLLDLCVPFS
jgi:beta-1,4-mannooligosaccharide/beta-1,4-mannosyl-N-acetylglucosamine phosphorylase